MIGMDPSFTSFGVYSDQIEGGLVIKTLPVEGVSEEVSTLYRCAQICRTLNTSQILTGETQWYIEAPMMRVPAHGGSHLYQVGFLMATMFGLANQNGAEIVLVPNATLLKGTLGTGRVPKNELALRVFETYGKKFEKDAGNDKLFAYLLYRYGTRVESGIIKHTPSARRGKRKPKNIIVGEAESTGMASSP